MATQDYSPDKDAGWGLIFRLNALWEKADRVSLSANYDKWELVIDKIFSNLLYRNPTDSIRNDVGKIIDVKITENDLDEWKIMKAKIKKAKTNKKFALAKRNAKLLNQAHEDYYNSILFYEMWVRKFMQRHQLYLKETEHNPSKALFGGAFGKK